MPRKESSVFSPLAREESKELEDEPDEDEADVGELIRGAEEEGRAGSPPIGSWGIHLESGDSCTAV